MERERVLVGLRVRHGEFGEGTIRALGSGNGVLKVFFDLTDTIEVVTSASVVALADGSSVRPPPAPSASRVPGPSGSSRDERRLAIECLRQGLPPPGKLTSWTVGHLDARAQIDAAISKALQGKGTLLAAKAAYGQGKSHLGRLGRELARERGLASFHVELDGAGRSLANGTSLIATLFASAELPASGEDHDHLVPGLASILRRTATRPRVRVPIELKMFEPFLQNPAQWAESEEVVEILEGYLAGSHSVSSARAALRKLLEASFDLPPLGMNSGSSADRRRCQADQLGRIVQLTQFAGSRGAFIVLDELDHDFRGNYKRQLEMLVSLRRVVEEGPVVLLLLARELTFSGLVDLNLSRFTNAELCEIVHKTIDAFGAVYPSPSLARGRDALFVAMLSRYETEYEQSGWGPRFFVRATIEACEVARSRRLESLAQVTFEDDVRGTH